MKTWKVLLGAFGAALLVVILGLGIAAYGWYFLGWETLGPAARETAQVLSTLGIVAAAVGSLILAALTWMLWMATVELNKSSVILAKIAEREFDEKGPVPEVRHTKIVPIVDAAYMDEGEASPDPELEVEVWNVGARPLTVTHVLVDVEMLHPDYDKNGNLVAMDSSTKRHTFPVEAADLVEGVTNPIPVGGHVTWSVPNHQIGWEPELRGYRIGVKDAGGREAWGPAERKKPD